MKSKGELEAEICQAIIRFEKEFMGRGPLETKTYLIEDMVFVRLQGVMTPAEHRLAQAEEGPRGRDSSRRQGNGCSNTVAPSWRRSSGTSWAWA